MNILPKRIPAPKQSPNTINRPPEINSSPSKNINADPGIPNLREVGSPMKPLETKERVKMPEKENKDTIWQLLNKKRIP
jgi:hypothetical protein